MEPIIHSHLTDELDKDHLLAFKQVYCDARRTHECNGLLHAANNECMTTWIEFAGLNVCAEIFAHYVLNKADGVLMIDEFRDYMEVD